MCRLRGACLCWLVSGNYLVLPNDSKSGYVQIRVLDMKGLRSDDEVEMKTEGLGLQSPDPGSVSLLPV